MRKNALTRAGRQRQENAGRQHGQHTGNGGRENYPEESGQSRGILADTSSFPDEGGQSPAFPIAPMREKSLAIGERAPLAAADVGNAEPVQPPDRETDGK